MTSLLERIRVRIHEGRPNDHPGQWLSVLPPVSQSELAAAEAQLGFRLPALLCRLYTEIGNGGFGPEFGLIPLSSESLGASPPPQAEFDLVSGYLSRLGSHSEIDPERDWPEGLVPVFYCGCTVFEFVNCQDQFGSVTWLDEGTEELVALRAGRHPVVPSLERRLESWLVHERVW